MSAGKRILLGRIVAAHGIRGEVLLKTFTADPAAIDAYGALRDEAGSRAFEIKVVRVSDKGLIARIAGISDRTAAERLKGTDLYVDRARLPTPEPGEFYHADLIDLTVVDPQGREIGTVVAVQNFGAGDLVEIRLTGARTTDYVPFQVAFVPMVDIEAGRVTVVMPTSASDETPVAG